ncbi:MAG TPA: ankyrin repeat domain-containing protein [Vicinamibacterales bacterium]|jgi:ankyrin repeat protein
MTRVLTVVVVLLSCAARPAAASGDRRLADAAQRRDRAAIQTLLSGRADVNGRQPDGATALHWAAHWDDAETVARLVGAGARVDLPNDLGVTPLSLACVNGSARVARVLLDAGADPNLALPSGETPLMTAARSGGLDLVTLLLERGADLEAREPARSQTALMWALSEKQHDVVGRLLEWGADPAARSKSGFTPLLFAARNGDVPSATLLLDRRVDVNAAAADGVTPLLAATVRGFVPMIVFLLDRGADANASTTGYTALHWAAGSWETELSGPRGVRIERDDEWEGVRGLGEARVRVIQALLAHGANPNALVEKAPPRVGFSVFRTSALNGATPYWIAAMSGQVEAMRALAAAGADTRRAAKDGTTPLMAASGVGRVLAETRVTLEQSVQAARLAIEGGSDVNATNTAGDTALHGAAHIRSDALVQLLADRGARLDVKNRRGETPLMISERSIAAGSAPVFERTSTGDLLRKLGASDSKPPSP